jgi:Ni,Fe-hydrogenase III large subunit/NADH:ubiquinone oxidoreductase subunit C
METLAAQNNQRVALADIPVHPYTEFLELNTRMAALPECHCVLYFALPEKQELRLLCVMANDNTFDLHLSSSLVTRDTALPSFTAVHPCFHLFEREIHENTGLAYSDHPWLKPVRYAENRYDRSQVPDNYPFYKMQGEDLHEVGVGPIHAGVIEPGHFRFICSGEKILHLEIVLGYQHRGIEPLMLQLNSMHQKATLAETIAGDTVAGHSTAFVNAMENLCGYTAPSALQFNRCLAMELERIAIHTGDLSALCTDIAYQLGSSVFGRLRTPIINFMQCWCGNRLSKGLIRPGENPFPFTPELKKELFRVLDAYEPEFNEMCEGLFHLTSVLSRFEKTGIVTQEQVSSIGTVGISARMSGIARDIRKTHPHDYYKNFYYEPVVKHHGDVYSRAQIRREEVELSLGIIRKMLDNAEEQHSFRDTLPQPAASSLVVSMTEGWRGEIAHCAMSGDDGALRYYKIKDPSFHNWMALALSVRNNEISDFPICNKSFNLSYCGFDL